MALVLSLLSPDCSSRDPLPWDVAVHRVRVGLPTSAQVEIPFLTHPETYFHGESKSHQVDKINPRTNLKGLLMLATWFCDTCFVCISTCVC